MGPLFVLFVYPPGGALCPPFKGSLLIAYSPFCLLEDILPEEQAPPLREEKSKGQIITNGMDTPVVLVDRIVRRNTMCYAAATLQFCGFVTVPHLKF